MKNNPVILRCIVGSVAHGLNTPESDIDYRSVYVTPTTEILSLGHKYKGSDWIEGDTQDNTAWEIGHFLHLATKCNPTILEVFKAPRENIGEFDKDNTYAIDLIDLFPYVWNPTDSYNAFVGYSLNQRKKLLDNKDKRWNKYAVAYLRTLWNLCDLLATGTFSLEVKDLEFKHRLLQIRNFPESITFGQVIDDAEVLKKKADELLPKCTHKPDIDKVNNFLLKIRKEFWK